MKILGELFGDNNYGDSCGGEDHIHGYREHGCVCDYGDGYGDNDDKHGFVYDTASEDSVYKYGVMMMMMMMMVLFMSMVVVMMMMVVIVL